jgi:hypothetical protein
LKKRYKFLFKKTYGSDFSTGFEEIKTLLDLKDFDSFVKVVLKLFSTDDDVFDVFVSLASVDRGITAKTRRKADMTNPIFNFMMKSENL